MNTTRRTLITGLAVAPALMLPIRFALGAEPLKISHQFPGGSEKEGDFRHRLCIKFGQEVEKRSNGALKINTYPGSSLMKVNAQFSDRATTAHLKLLQTAFAQFAQKAEPLAVQEQLGSFARREERISKRFRHQFDVWIDRCEQRFDYPFEYEKITAAA